MICENALNTVKEIEKSLSLKFDEISDIATFNQEKILKAFHEANISLSHFASSSGYGYDDLGKVKLAEVFSKVFGTEDAIVSPLITCGTHALTLGLFGILRPGDQLISYGETYDTLKQVIAGKGNGSLADFGIKYEIIPMEAKKERSEAHKTSCEEIEKIVEVIKTKKPKVFYLQRSKGYANRTGSITCDFMKTLFDKIKTTSPKTIIFVDNCYGEFISKYEPTDVGADVMVGSLIKNPGGGIAPTGAYIAGKKHLIQQIAGRFTAPTLREEVGSYNTSYQTFFEGFFLSPSMVSRALKGSMLIGKVMEGFGYKTYPDPNEIPTDFVRSVEFKDENKLIKFCQTVQSLSPVDSRALPLPWDMPGYKDKIIMASGSFVQGSSSELSADGPIRPPYTAYLQGGLTYEHLRLLAIHLCGTNDFV